MRGVWLRETPRPQVPSATFAMGAERREGHSEQPLPAEALPTLPPPRPLQDNARPLFRWGLGRGGRIRARAFRPQPTTPPPTPTPSATPAAHRWFSAREGQAPALLYNNRALRAWNAPPGRRGPGRTTPPSGPGPTRPAPRRLGGTLLAGLASTCRITC